jgi:hypothetical protein
LQRNEEMLKKLGVDKHIEEMNKQVRCSLPHASTRRSCCSASVMCVGGTASVRCTNDTDGGGGRLPLGARVCAAATVTCQHQAVSTLCTFHANRPQTTCFAAVQKQEQLKELRQKRQEAAERRKQDQQAAAAAQPRRVGRYCVVYALHNSVDQLSRRLLCSAAWMGSGGAAVILGEGVGTHIA